MLTMSLSLISPIAAYLMAALILLSFLYISIFYKQVAENEWVIVQDIYGKLSVERESFFISPLSSIVYTGANNLIEVNLDNNTQLRSQDNHSLTMDPKSKLFYKITNPLIAYKTLPKKDGKIDLHDLLESLIDPATRDFVTSHNIQKEESQDSKEQQVVNEVYSNNALSEHLLAFIKANEALSGAIEVMQCNPMLNLGEDSLAILNAPVKAAAQQTAQKAINATKVSESEATAMTIKNLAAAQAEATTIEACADAKATSIRLQAYIDAGIESLKAGELHKDIMVASQASQFTKIEGSAPIMQVVNHP